MFYRMKELRYCAVALIALLLSACGSVNESLEKMIPADATGVVSIDVPGILTKAQLLNDGEVSIPAELQEVIDGNDAAALCKVLTDLPVLGIDTNSKAFAFFTLKTFGRVLLVALNDEQAARKTLSQRLGTDFAAVDGLDCIYQEDNLYVINDKVLFVGTVNMPIEKEKAVRTAKGMFQRNTRSVLEVEEVNNCLLADNEINAYFQLEGIKALLKRSSTYKDIAKRMPLIEVFTESDIKALTCAMKLNEDHATLNTHFIVDENSDYLKLMKATITKPDSEFLKVIPNTMNYVVAMSVNGQQFTQLAQIKQLLKTFGKIPIIGRINLEQMLATIDGPVAVALSHDPYLEGEWNAVVAASSSNPDEVVNTIAHFAQSMGQAPELYDNEYVYQYDNKMIKVGANDGVVYMKMLNYEQTEGYAGDDAVMKDLFGNNAVAVSAHMPVGKTDAYFHYGLSDMIDGSGKFFTKDKTPVALALLKVLCSIKPAQAFDDMFDDSDPAVSVIGAAIDGFHELN